jgi:hypothetical protein
MPLESTASITKPMSVLEDLDLGLILDHADQLSSLKCIGRSPSRFKRLIPELVAEVRQLNLIKPAYSYKIIAIENRTLNVVRLNGGWTIKSPLLIHRLAGASLLAVGVITIGDALTNRVSKKFAEGHYLAAMALDEIGNLALFHLSGQIEDICAAEAARRGLRSSGVLSPGDDGFGLQCQQTLLAMAEAKKCNVRLNDSGFMLPVRSLSVVAGLGKRVKQWSQIESCATCSSREKCRLRQATA